ncbi:PREDICTED: RING-H2 finger protein ATL2 [Tarenaya hassleriana]|uniref:RING-H2 finger protein ATL2 n=1 Tax=Tarenaya hassleriana TaxID=28532 RepID=UPI00053C3748|nr:PREDICTED: RING-H2 finger protein ATL2 [Tarenaya hassleriana]
MSSNNPDLDSVGAPGDFSGPRSYALSGKIMLSAIVILFFVVILMVCLHLYARWYLLRARRRYLRRRRRNRHPTTVFFVDPSASAASGAAGLDPTVIKSLPVFSFSAATHPDPIECAVCLCEFEEDEAGRVLPNCKHTFHVECIDMWFHSHSTCPLCRSLVEPVPGEQIQAAEEVAIVIPEDPAPSSELCDTCRVDSDGAGTSMPEERRIKPPAIDVPRRNPCELENEATRSDSPVNQSFRSPMSRMLSFKRILSRDWRTASSPSGGSPSPSAYGCGTSVTESDVEQGREEGR